jgi:hypothetical protein
MVATSKNSFRNADVINAAEGTYPSAIPSRTFIVIEVYFGFPHYVR